MQVSTPLKEKEQFQLKLAPCLSSETKILAASGGRALMFKQLLTSD